MQQPDQSAPRFGDSIVGCGVAGSTPEDQAQLHQRLMTLLPADGTPMTTTALARLTGAATWQVTEALIDDYMAGRLDFAVRSDAFSLRVRTASTAA